MKLWYVHFVFIGHSIRRHMQTYHTVYVDLKNSWFRNLMITNTHMTFLTFDEYYSVYMRSSPQLARFSHKNTESAIVLTTTRLSHKNTESTSN